jgi:hypothetical protein
LGGINANAKIDREKEGNGTWQLATGQKNIPKATRVRVPKKSMSRK